MGTADSGYSFAGCTHVWSILFPFPSMSPKDAQQQLVELCREAIARLSENADDSLLCDVSPLLPLFDPLLPILELSHQPIDVEFRLKFEGTPNAAVLVLADPLANGPTREILLGYTDEQPNAGVEQNLHDGQAEATIREAAKSCLSAWIRHYEHRSEAFVTLRDVASAISDSMAPRSIPNAINKAGGKMPKAVDQRKGSANKYRYTELRSVIERYKPDWALRLPDNYEAFQAKLSG